MKIRRVIRGLFVIIALLAIGAFVLWRVSVMPPSWYSPPDPVDLKVIERADRVEYAVVEQSQKIRPPEDEWTLTVTEDQINAWLSARLPQWLASKGDSRWPEQLGTPQVHIEVEGISVGLPLLTRNSSRTLVMRVQPKMADGLLELQLDRIAVGRIALGGEPLANLLQLLNDTVPEALNSPEIQPVIEMLTQRKPIEPIFDLADDRRVRVLNVVASEGAIALTARTMNE